MHMMKDQARQIKKPYCGILAIHHDHPHRRIKIKFCMGGSLRVHCTGSGP